ncbi:MAG: geranylgeranyl diphosphate synthase, type [Acidobacteriota bacterium]|jgi:geranylgeranyl diphosphate synthase type I|nr:geranylgeranyl diphosphate synthase, type [Acidobacteriota bacterium]
MGLSTEAPTTDRPTAVPDRFQDLLAGFRGKLDRALADWLEVKRQDAAAGDSPEMLELIDGVGQLATHGGKRLRPALVYYTYRAFGGTSDHEALPLSLATELLHTYLLIHDDIMDHAEVRRGLPAAHVRFSDAHRAHGLKGDAADFGRSVAILLGDLAQSWAVELATPAFPRSGGELGRCFSAMCQEVVGGQYLELLVAQRRAATEEELLRVLRLKSGRYTAERPIQLGALLAGAPARAIADLSRYGAAVGEAFQLQDDLLGMFGDAGTMGKPVDADLREGKYTFLIHRALEAADPGQRRALEAALGNPDATAAQVDGALEVLEETGAHAAVKAMIAERLRAARAALADLSVLDLAPEGRLFFAGLIDYLRERER